MGSTTAGSPPEGLTRITAIHKRLSQFEPKTERESILFHEALDQFNLWFQQRSSRLANLDTCLPLILWWILIVGAVINMLILYAIRIEPFHAHLTLTGLVACFIGLMIFLIAAMDHPFQGELSIDPTTVRNVTLGLEARGGDGSEWSRRPDAWDDL